MLKNSLLAVVAVLGMTTVASAQTAAEMRAAQTRIEAEMRARGVPAANASAVGAAAMSAAASMTPADRAAAAAAIQAEMNARSTRNPSAR